MPPLLTVIVAEPGFFAWRVPSLFTVATELLLLENRMRPFGGRPLTFTSIGTLVPESTVETGREAVNDTLLLSVIVICAYPGFPPITATRTTLPGESASTAPDSSTVAMDDSAICHLGTSPLMMTSSELYAWAEKSSVSPTAKEADSGEISTRSGGLTCKRRPMSNRNINQLHLIRD